MSDATVAEMMKYAPVLERVVDLVTHDPKLKYVDALDQAMQSLGISVPQEVQDAILTVSIRISVNCLDPNQRQRSPDEDQSLG